MKPTITAICASLGCLASAGAAPTGLQIGSGQADISTAGAVTTIRNSAGAILNWQSFSIAEGETVRFQQPSIASSVLNRVTGIDPSLIHGQLQSNGQVFLINPNGILVGPDARIDVHGLVASTLPLSDTDFAARRLRFGANTLTGQATQGGTLTQQGAIRTPTGGYIYLIGHSVINNGTLDSPDGRIAMAAGDQVTLSEHASGDLSVTLSGNTSRLVNTGQISAGSGRIDLYGALVSIEPTGVLKADSASVDDGGRIILKASRQLDMAGQLSARGGPQGGNGGHIETSGASIRITGRVDTGAPEGQVGSWLIDPRRLCIYASSSDECSANSNAFNQTGLYDSGPAGIDTPGGGNALDSLLSVASINAAAVETSVILQADELISILPSGGAWELPGNGQATFISPIVFVNGNLRNIGGSSGSNGLRIDTVSSGASGTNTAVGFPNRSIMLGPQAFLEGGSPFSVIELNAQQFDLAAGAVIAAGPPGGPSDLGTLSTIRFNGFASGTRPDGDRIPVRFNNGSLSNNLQADRFEWNMPADWIYAGSPLNLSVRHAVARLRLDGLLSNDGSSFDGLCIASSRTCIIGTLPVAETRSAQDLSNIGGASGSFTVNLEPLNDSTGRTPFLLVRALPQTPSTLTRLTSPGDVFITGLGLDALSLPGSLTVRSGRNMSVGGSGLAAGGSLTLQAENAIQVDSPVTANDTLTLIRRREIFGGPCQTCPEIDPGLDITSKLEADRVVLQLNTLPPEAILDNGTVLEGSFPQSSAATLRLSANATVVSREQVADIDVDGLANSLMDASTGPLPASVAPSGIVVQLGRRATFVNEVGPSVFMPTGRSFGWQLSIAAPAANDTNPPQHNFGGLLTPDVIQISNADAANNLCGTRSDCQSKTPTELNFYGYTHWLLANAGSDTPAPPPPAPPPPAPPPPAPPPPAPPPPAPPPPAPPPPAPPPPAPPPPALPPPAPPPPAPPPPAPPPPAPPPPAPPPPATSSTEASPSTVDICAASPTTCTFMTDGRRTGNAGTMAGALPAFDEQRIVPATVSIRTPIGTTGLGIEQRTGDTRSVTGAQGKAYSINPMASDNRGAPFASADNPAVTNAMATTLFGRLPLSSLAPPQRRALLDLRSETKRILLGDAIASLRRNPAISDLPPCSVGGRDACVSDESLQQAKTLALIPSQSRQADTPPRTQLQGNLRGQRRALVVGINHYSDPAIPSLDTAIADAKAIAHQLNTQFNFDVEVLQDASRESLVTALRELAQRSSPDDSVVVYYAGHGYLDSSSGRGYWILSDSESRSASRWLGNRDIARLLGQIPARQVLLVSDSCFSGALLRDVLRSNSLREDPASVLNRRSVVALSSGGDEPVSDEGGNGHSVFADSLMKTLSGISGLDIGSRIHADVSASVLRQVPQRPVYGGIRDARHDSEGEFIFETGRDQANGQNARPIMR